MSVNISVSGFKKMYKNVVVDIVEEPAERNARFRYSCEGRTAGSIVGFNSTPENRTYPAIRLLNYTGAAVVVVSCVSKDEPFRPHPHGLVGKGCCKGVCKIEFNTNESAPTVITLKNIGIQCCRKNDIDKLLTERESIRVDPFQTGFKHKNAKYGEIDVSAVRLCFQVLLRPRGDDKYKFHTIKPVVSSPIFDKRSMAGLLIYDISDTTSPTNGRKKIMIFCDKIAKNDIRIRFYRKDENDSVEWEGWGEFKPRDVHHQYAIAIQTPPYATNDINNPVKVFLQLVRPSDGYRSEPLDFHYIPHVSNVNNAVKNKKRKIEQSKEFCDYVQVYEEQQRQKSKMKINIDPMTGYKEVADKENIEPPAALCQSNFNIPGSQLHSYSQNYHLQEQHNYQIQQLPQQNNYLHQSCYHSCHQQPEASHLGKLENNHFQLESLNNHLLQQTTTPNNCQSHYQQPYFSQKEQKDQLQQQSVNSNFLQQPQNSHMKQPSPLISTYSQQAQSGHVHQQTQSSYFCQQQQLQQNNHRQQQPLTNSPHQQHQSTSSPFFQQTMFSNSGYGGLNVAVNYMPVSYYSNVEQQNNSTPQNQFGLNNLTASNQQSTFEKNIVEDMENMSDSFNSLLLL